MSLWGRPTGNAIRRNPDYHRAVSRLSTALVAARAVGGVQRCASRPACSFIGRLIRWISMADIEASTLSCAVNTAHGPPEEEQTEKAMGNPMDRACLYVLVGVGPCVATQGGSCLCALVDRTHQRSWKRSSRRRSRRLLPALPAVPCPAPSPLSCSPRPAHPPSPPPLACLLSPSPCLLLSLSHPRSTFSPPPSG